MNFFWLIKTESYKRGMAVSVAFNIVAKGLLFLLTVLIAGFFGTGIRTDIYFFVYGTMVLLSGFVNTIDTVVLVPESMRLRQREGKEAAMAFLNFFLRIYFFTGVLFVVLVFFCGTPVFVRFSRFPEADVLAYRSYFLMGSLYFFFQVLTGCLGTILSSLKFFTVPMVISGINSCIVITGILLLHHRYDVLSIFIGGIAAYGINLVLLLLVMKKWAGWDFFTKSTGLKKRTWTNIFFSQLGQLATLASSFFPLYLLSGFGQGVISLMNYGKNIADIPNTLVTAHLTGVSGIKLNEQAADGDRAGIADTFLHTGKLLLFILLPVGCFLFVFAEPVVRLFYLRGSFGAGSISESAKFLQLLSVTLFSTGINAIVTRVFIARQAIRQAFLYQVLLNVLLIAAIWMFTRHYGAYGYPYGIILMNGVNYLLMFFICKKLVSEIDYGSILKQTGLLLLANGAIAAAIYVADPCKHLGSLPGLFSGFIAYLILLLGLNGIFHFNPLPGQLLQYARKRPH